MTSWKEKVNRCRCLINDLDEMANGDDRDFLDAVREEIINEYKFKIDDLLICLENIHKDFMNNNQPELQNKKISDMCECGYRRPFCKCGKSGWEKHKDHQKKMSC
jgi:hypothetical protein